MVNEPVDPAKEIEKLMSQFRSEASSVASGVASSIADALALPFKLPLPAFKAAADAIAQAPEPAAPAAPPAFPAIPFPPNPFGIKGIGQPREGAGMPGWTGARQENVEQKPDKLAFLGADIGM